MLSGGDLDGDLYNVFQSVQSFPFNACMPSLALIILLASCPRLEILS